MTRKDWPTDPTEIQRSIEEAIQDLVRMGLVVDPAVKGYRVCRMHAPAVVHRRGKGTAISGMAAARKKPPKLRATSGS
jgi:hypothetical protein